MEDKFQEELISSLNTIVKHWDKKDVHLSHDEVSRVDATIAKLSFFSKNSSPDECKSVIASLQNIIKNLTVEVKSEEKELQAETHGGQSFTEDELERINEYAYRTELVQWLQHALDMIYAARPEFKPK